MSDAWLTTAAMWRDFIDTDSGLRRPPMVPDDEFDARLTKRLENANFLGGLEETSVTAMQGDLGPEDAGGPGEFDSMTTMVRPSPPAEEVDFQTVARPAPSAPSPRVVVAEEAGADPTPVPAPPEATVQLEVAVEVPESGLRVELAPSSDVSPSPDAGASATEDVDGLYIPSLTRPNEAPPAAAFTESVPESTGSPDVSAGPVAPEPVVETQPQPSYEPLVPAADEPRTGHTLPPSAPEAAPTAAVEPAAAAVEPAAALLHAAEASPPPPDPAPPQSGGTMPPVTELSADADAARAPAVASGGTVVSPGWSQPYQESPSPPPAAPEPSPPPPQRPALEAVADQSAASSQTAGEIVSRVDPAEESITAGTLDPSVVAAEPDPSASASGMKVVISQAPPEEDAEEVDADDILESEMPSPDPIAAAPATPEPEPEPAPVATPPSAPPKPPPASKSKKEGKPPPAPPLAARSETASALAGLAVERDGGAAAVLEKAAERATKTGAWHEEAFGEHYAAVTRPGHPRLAKAEVDFFLQGSGLPAGARVLDVGCGDGAHSMVLAQRGFAVTGFDASLPQLLRATQANEALAAGAVFVHGDMRDPPVEGAFDGILCLGSTLGFFDEADNRTVFRKLREHLAPGGRMLLQCFNRDHVIGRLPARSWWQGHGCQVLDEVQMDYFTNRLNIKRAIVFEDGRQFEHRLKIRAYSAHDFGAICVENGLRVIEISGSLQTRGRFYGATSPEIWLLVEPKS